MWRIVLATVTVEKFITLSYNNNVEIDIKNCINKYYVFK